MIRPKSISPEKPRFAVGQLVEHRRYGYHGVVVALDTTFKAPESWYMKNQTQPNKNQAWYHVLVHNSDGVTYAAEDSLQSDRSGLEINHPLVKQLFKSFEEGAYIRSDEPWQGW